MRYQPEPGDFFVAAGKGPVGAGIRLFTRSRWTHAGMVVETDGATVEALRDGAAYSHVRPGYVICSPPLSGAQRVAAARVARGLLHTPYGAADIAALALLTTGIRWGWLQRKVAASDSMICSQLVDEVYRAAGFPLFADGRPAAMVTPAALGELAARNGWMRGSEDTTVGTCHTAKTAR